MKNHIWTFWQYYFFSAHLRRDISLGAVRQLAIVEVAACIVLGVQLYLLSSSVGDWIEKENEKPSKSRSWLRSLIADTVGVSSQPRIHFVK